jgi:hypothetical protein
MVEIKWNATGKKRERKRANAIKKPGPFLSLLSFFSDGRDQRCPVGATQPSPCAMRRCGVGGVGVRAFQRGGAMVMMPSGVLRRWETGPAPRAQSNRATKIRATKTRWPQGTQGCAQMARRGMCAVLEVVVMEEETKQQRCEAHGHGGQKMVPQRTTLSVALTPSHLPQAPTATCINAVAASVSGVWAGIRLRGWKKGGSHRANRAIKRQAGNSPTRSHAPHNPIHKHRHHSTTNYDLSTYVYP